MLDMCTQQFITAVSRAGRAQFVTQHVQGTWILVSVSQHCVYVLTALVYNHAVMLQMQLLTGSTCASCITGRAGIHPQRKPVY
jgi:hypothetical protein